MIAIFTLLYIFAIWLVYVRMKIRPNPINLAVAVVVGILGVGTIVILWQFSAPMSKQLVASRYTIQLVPQVRGPVSKIVAEANEPLEQGKSVLLTIQTDLYQYALNQATAALETANKTVEQLEAGVKVAAATTLEADANRAAVEAELDSAKETAKLNPVAISKLKVTQVTQQFEAAKATVAKAQAAETQAQAALQAAQSTVVSSQAQLDTAKFNLEQCTVYAPADGFVTNWQVREGTMAVPLPLAPLGTFVDTSRLLLVGSFSQNTAKNIMSGDKAEFALKSLPGQIITGTVDSVIQATGEGQFTTSGKLISAASIHSQGLYAITFKLDDEELAHSLAMGTAGVAAVYTDTGKPFHVISKVTVRIKAWLYYLIPM